MRIQRNFAMHTNTLAAPFHRSTEDPYAGVGISECPSARRSTDHPSVDSGSVTFPEDENSAIKLVEIVGAADE